MGASLSLKIKSVQNQTKVTGIVRSEESKTKGLELKIADSIFTEKEFAKDRNYNPFDLIIFSTPVDLICKKISILPNLKNTVLTDLGSTKTDIHKAVEKKFKTSHNYISSHPMAGSEQTGLSFSKENLYDGKLCILTKPKLANQNSYLKLEKFWKQIGCVTIEMKAEEHDEVLAYLSHTPHILSSILVNWAYSNKKVKMNSDKFPFPLTGGGFRDMSRIAGSNPDMWDAIISSNEKNITDSLKKFKLEIESILEKIGKNKKENFWKDYFSKSRISRAKILKLKE
jgi:prephenate dehydrogenase